MPRTLSRTWNRQSNHLVSAKLNLCYENKNITQRKLLSMAAFLFDRICINSPFEIRLRRILQKVNHTRTQMGPIGLRDCLRLKFPDV